MFTVTGRKVTICELKLMLARIGVEALYGMYMPNHGRSRIRAAARGVTELYLTKHCNCTTPHASYDDSFENEGYRRHISSGGKGMKPHGPHILRGQTVGVDDAGNQRLNVCMTIDGD